MPLILTTDLASRSLGIMGTPIQNSLQDVYALLKLLGHERCCEAGFWKAAITNAATEITNEDCKCRQVWQFTRQKSKSLQNQVTARRTVALCWVKRFLPPLLPWGVQKIPVHENGYAKYSITTIWIRMTLLTVSQIQHLFFFRSQPISWCFSANWKLLPWVSSLLPAVSVVTKSRRRFLEWFLSVTGHRQKLRGFCHFLFAR